MNITKELRGFANSGMSAMECATYSNKLIAIADRIDMEHNEAMQQALMGEGSVPATDENMAEHGWIRLPKDADGVPIHVGDELCNYTLSGYPYPNGGVYCKAIVNERMVLVGQKESSFKDLLMWEASWCRHHYAPTVEDVLLEACKAYHGLMVEGMNDFAHDMPAPSEIIAEYAAKLQLKED